MVFFNQFGLLPIYYGSPPRILMLSLTALIVLDGSPEYLIYLDLGDLRLLV
jgi:hypothetical protein